MKKLTLKEKQFVKITAQTLNPTQAVRETYQIGKNGGSKDKKHKNNTIVQIARENLTKPHIVKSLQEAMEEKGIDNELIISITKRNLQQDSNIPASNQVLDMIHKLKGNYAPDRRVNINITPDNIDNLLNERIREVEALRVAGHQIDTQDSPQVVKNTIQNDMDKDLK